MALDRDNPFYAYKASAPTVDASDAAEKAKIAAMRKANAASRPATFLEQVENQIAKTQARVTQLEADAPLDLTKPVNKMTSEELKAYQKARINAQRVEREDIQSGDNPDNPMPTEDPGPGMYWANYGGVWRKYKYVTDSPGGGGGGNGNGGGGNGGGADGAGGIWKAGTNVAACMVPIFPIPANIFITSNTTFNHRGQFRQFDGPF